MNIVETVRELRAARAALPGPVGLVPTMGFLHEGHLSLIRRARAECGSVIVSIFVNPTQFGPNEDFGRYPRDLPRDLRLCEESGTDLVFTPPVPEVYPDDATTFVEVERLTERWEGASRPTHFRGVATVVAKLFRMSLPDFAYFGEKDYQQLQIVRRMARDLLLDVDVVGCPIIRDDDGLALSSRNVLLSPAGRDRALALSRALRAAQDSADRGVTSAAEILATVERTLLAVDGITVDYTAVVDPTSLEPIHDLAAPARALIAARVESVRLIDNAELRPHQH